MNISEKSALFLVTLSATGSLAANAAMPERAQATYYVPQPAVQQNTVPSSGNSQYAPQIVLPHIHPSVSNRVTRWYWDHYEIFHGQFLICAGWDHDVLVNRMEFVNPANPVFSRQCIMHYETLPSGFQKTTVECYGADDSYQGKTEYLSSVVNNKLYLAQVNLYSRYNYKVYQLDVHWSPQGVTATLGNADINLKANQDDFLPKHFYMWQKFGLKL